MLMMYQMYAKFMFNKKLINKKIFWLNIVWEKCNINTLAKKL